MAEKKGKPRGTAATAMTPKKLHAFCETLRDTGNVTASAEAAGISRAHAYKMRGENEEFAAAWDEALEQAIDSLEQEARRRAMEGWDEEVYQNGGLVGTKRRYSDTLMCALLNAHRPDKFRYNAKVDHNVESLGKVTIVMPDNGRGPADE